MSTSKIEEICENQFQKKYWNELKYLRYHVEYFNLCYSKSEKIENSINIFLAITSNTSMCVWAIWNHLGWLWAILIAASQLINAIKLFMPYKKRIKAFRNLVYELSELFIYAETKWYHAMGYERHRQWTIL